MEESVAESTHRIVDPQMGDDLNFENSVVVQLQARYGR
jgi:hypothetical protein